MSIIKAPWTDEQVKALNTYQAGLGHPYTCGSGNRTTHGDGEGVLTATTNGWVCQWCDYTQDWAHAMAPDPEARGRCVI